MPWVRRGLATLCLAGGVALTGLWIWLEVSPPPPLLEGVPFSCMILDRHGDLLRLGLASDDKYRIRVGLDEIAPEAVQAALLYEDRYFYRHPGVNPFAVLRAAWATYLGGERRMGGSTITMQVARLRLGLITTTWIGKLRQMVAALHLERHYSKQRILEAYFNLAPYGGNVEGIGAAARVYFRKTAGRLGRAESLALAVVPQNPSRRAPLGGKEFDAARGRLTALWNARVPARGLSLAGGVPPLRVYSPSELPFEAPHAASELLSGCGQGERIRSTLDMPIQHVLEREIRRFTARGRAYGLENAAALLVHWPDMEIHALVGSADFHSTRIQGQVDGTRARRSPGSTLKPFIYALALEQGLIHPMTLLEDSPRSFGGYDPENFDRSFRGPIPACEALRTSRNLPAIALAARLHDPDLYDFLRRGGIFLPQEPSHYGLGLVLGGAEVTMRELAQLYAMLANRGLLRSARLTRGAAEEFPVRLLSPEAAFVTLSMLEDPSRIRETARGRVPLPLKTGTSNGFRDAWAAGVAGQYVLVVWVGNFDNRANPLLVGGEVAAPLFEDMVRALAHVRPLKDLVAEHREGLNVREVEVCTATGDLDTSLCGDVITTLFIPGMSPVRSSGVFRTILVDRYTGLRACAPEPGRTEERVWEFWPSNLRRIFLRAGIVKPPPPPFSPECAALRRSSERAPLGNPPRISIPKEGVLYRLPLADPARGRLPLTADADADARSVFWFAGDRFLGRSAPGRELLWTPPPGTTELRAVDDRGRASRRRLLVRVAP